MSENLEKVAQWTISFGKYSGKTYGEIVSSDPSYAKWLSTIVKSDKVKEYLLSVTTTN